MRREYVNNFPHFLMTFLAAFPSHFHRTAYITNPPKSTKTIICIENWNTGKRSFSFDLKKNMFFFIPGPTLTTQTCLNHIRSLSSSPGSQWALQEKRIGLLWCPDCPGISSSSSLPPSTSTSSSVFVATTIGSCHWWHGIEMYSKLIMMDIPPKSIAIIFSIQRKKNDQTWHGR